MYVEEQDKGRVEDEMSSKCCGRAGNLAGNG